MILFVNYQWSDTALVYAVVIGLKPRKLRGQEVPFGHFLALGGLLSFVAGATLIEIYLSMLGL